MKSKYIEKNVKYSKSYKDQILIAVKSIFDSWNNDRAILYENYNIDNNIGAAVVIQEMSIWKFQW